MIPLKLSTIHKHKKTMLKLNAAKRSELRAQAHTLEPVVLIGAAGLTPNVLKEINIALNVHGLIKVRVPGDDRQVRVDIYDAICTQLNAAPIQQIGKLLVIYRPAIETPKERTEKRGPGTRTVTVVKASPSKTQRPTVSKVLLKGNERVTEAGNIKRVKKRQVSAKKRALDKS